MINQEKTSKITLICDGCGKVVETQIKSELLEGNMWKPRVEIPESWFEIEGKHCCSEKCLEEMAKIIALEVKEKVIQEKKAKKARELAKEVKKTKVIKQQKKVEEPKPLTEEEALKIIEEEFRGGLDKYEVWGFFENKVISLAHRTLPQKLWDLYEDTNKLWGSTQKAQTEWAEKHLPVSKEIERQVSVLLHKLPEDIMKSFQEKATNYFKEYLKAEK